SFSPQGLPHVQAAAGLQDRSFVDDRSYSCGDEDSDEADRGRERKLPRGLGAGGEEHGAGDGCRWRQEGQDPVEGRTEYTGNRRERFERGPLYALRRSYLVSA